jgi:tRNA A-37 threonylcarbamoyl transferase component Bud32
VKRRLCLSDYEKDGIITKERLIGVGAFSMVYLTENNTVVKVGSEKDYVNNNEIKCSVIAGRLGISPKLINGGENCIELEYLVNYKMYHYLSNNEKKKFYSNIKDKIHLFHNYGLIHRDLNGGNIMVNLDNNDIKFIDQGFSIFYEEDCCSSKMNKVLQEYKKEDLEMFEKRLL